VAASAVSSRIPIMIVFEMFAKGFEWHCEVDSEREVRIELDSGIRGLVVRGGGGKFAASDGNDA